MWQETYLENQVLTASPLELVRMLYRGAIDFVVQARRCLAAGDIAGRSKAIDRVQAILDELRGSLDPNAAAEISQNLSALYTYMRTRLTEANLLQKDAPLAETESLLTTLYKAWESAEAPAAESPAGPAMQFAPCAMAGGESHMWSA
jgi:flagellar secretion chaperone FliS